MMGPSSPEQIVLLAAAAAIRISKCVPPDELPVLAAFYTAIGDQLALISVAAAQPGKNASE